MKVHEYQAKALLAEFGVPVPTGRVAESPAEAGRIAAELGGRVVVKVQIHAGGRGKAGGIRLVDSPEMAEQAAAELIGRRLVTHQTGPDGVVVRRVLVEQPAAIRRELYLAILVDRTCGRPVVMASASGGMEIEEVAAHHPEAILRVHVDPVAGFRPFQARRLAFGLELDGQIRAFTDLASGLYRLFVEKDCSLAEINPLVLTDDDRLLALDCKLTFDDSALFRHPEVAALRDLAEEDPLEVEASKFGISYVKLAGQIGCMVNGAGLAMATMDIIKLAGGEPANFLDVGGGASADQVTNAFRILLSDPNVKAVLVNIFGGITRCDVVARGILEAAQRVSLTLPVVVRLAGTNVEEGQHILAESGLHFIIASDLRDAAEKAVAAVGASEVRGS
ncbi:MAG: ADP-forming succinate--CoA ligase subunit beta [Chloroflexi bacterium]|nr:ADP-forming succinate--CoA ligase subunit beta [Chloroflexota bacterium]